MPNWNLLVTYAGVLLLPGEDQRRKAASLLPILRTLWMVLFSEKKIYIYIPPLIVMWIGTRSTNVLRHLWFGLGFFLLSFGQTWLCQLSLSDCSFKSSLDNLKIITDIPDSLPAIFNHPSPANYLLKRASTGIWTETITTHSNLFNFNKMTSAKIYIYIA